MQILKTRSAKRSMKSELSLRNLGFDDVDAEVFYKSQWQSTQRSLYYLIHRWTLALIFTGIFLSCLILQFDGGKFFIYLTNWSLSLCMLTNIVGVCLVTRWHFGQEQFVAPIADYHGSSFNNQRTSSLTKVYWLLHGITVPLALVVSSVYWIFLHGRKDKPNLFPIISFLTHCLNSVLMLWDFFVVAFPVRLLHISYSMLLPITFTIFSVIFYACGGTDEFGNPYIYPILNWNKPSIALTTFFGVFGFYLLLGILLFLLYKLKCQLYKRLCAQTEEKDFT